MTSLVLVFLASFLRWADAFLSVNNPVPADVLIVESWLPDYALHGAAAEFMRSGCKCAITCGGPLADAGVLSRYTNGAELAAAKLQQLGLPAEAIVAIPNPRVLRDRTYSSALAVKKWSTSSNNTLRAVNIYSLAAHARRSRLLFQKALGDKVKVGVFAAPDPYYDSDRWWATSEGVRTVLAESLAYTYARCVFPLVSQE